MPTTKKRMQNTPLNGEECELVRAILQNVLAALQDCGDNRCDAGDRVVVNLHKRDVSRLRSTLKKL